MKLDISYKELSLLRDLLKDKKSTFFSAFLKLFFTSNKSCSTDRGNEIIRKYNNGEFLEDSTEDEKSCFSLLAKIDKIEKELQEELR